jgi:hypothetical protein
LGARCIGIGLRAAALGLLIPRYAARTGFLRCGSVYAAPVIIDETREKAQLKRLQLLCFRVFHNRPRRCRRRRPPPLDPQVAQPAAWRSDGAMRPLQSLRFKERLAGVTVDQMDAALAAELAGDIGVDRIVVGVSHLRSAFCGSLICGCSRSLTPARRPFEWASGGIGWCVTRVLLCRGFWGFGVSAQTWMGRGSGWPRSARERGAGVGAVLVCGRQGGRGTVARRWHAQGIHPVWTPLFAATLTPPTPPKKTLPLPLSRLPTPTDPENILRETPGCQQAAQGAGPRPCARRDQGRPTAGRPPQARAAAGRVGCPPPPLRAGRSVADWGSLRSWGSGRGEWALRSVVRPIQRKLSPRCDPPSAVPPSITPLSQERPSAKASVSPAAAP